MKNLDIYLESALSSNLDVNITVGDRFNIVSEPGPYMTPADERRLKANFDKYCKDFPRDLPHYKRSPWSIDEAERYFIDWVYSLPIHYVDSSEFAKNKPMMLDEFAKIAPTDKFHVELKPFHFGSKAIIFSWSIRKNVEPKVFLILSFLTK